MLTSFSDWMLVGFPTSTWGMPSLFGGRGSSSKSQANGSVNETFSDMDQKPSVIKLSEVLML